MSSPDVRVHVAMNPETQRIVIYCNSSVGIFNNLVLLFLTYTDRNKGSMGYKKMLAIIALYNCYYGLVHCITDMGSVCEKDGFVLFSKRFHEYGYVVSYIATAVFVTAFGMSITLLAIHCMYRYVKLSGKHTWIFNTWYGLTGVTILQFSFGICWLICMMVSMWPSAERDSLSYDHLMAKYNVDIHGLGYIGPVYSRTLPNGTVINLCSNMIGSIGAMLILAISFCVICFGGVRLYLFIKQATVSEQTRRIHYELLKVLIAQAMTPLVFEYVPCVLMCWGGLMSQHFIHYDMLLPIVTSSYTAADAFFIILFFKAYRERCLRVFRRSSYRVHTEQATVLSSVKTAGGCERRSNVLPAINKKIVPRVTRTFY